MDLDFSKRIIDIVGEAGKKWLNELPSIIQSYEKKWQIQCLSPFSLSYNYVLPAEAASGKSVVLKISYPSNHEFSNEIEALRFYDGIGSIKLIQEDSENNVVLLERAMPGTRIGDVQPDEKQISLVSEVIKKIHKPISLKGSFPTLVDWAQAFERYRKSFNIHSGPVPQRMFEEAEEIFTQFPKEDKQRVLLHGDFHNDNILLSERGWLTIDPKGVIGEAEYDIGTYLRNPYVDLPQNSNRKQIEKNRIIQFSEELGFDKKRIHKWAFANVVISYLWFLEDEKRFNEMYLRNAELILEINL